MRTTYHNGRGKAQHNDREFIRKGADVPANIDMNREYGIWTYQMGMDLRDEEYCCNYDDDWKGSLRDVELEYYKSHYADALSARNANYRKTGHSERCKTIEEWYEKTYPPEETILQIGTLFDVGETKEERESFMEDFILCLDEFVQWHEVWNQEHGNHVHLLSIAVHMDESTPHAHIRRTYDYMDKNGNLVIGTDRALEAAGIDIANPEKPPKKNSEKRFNNRKMTFDRMMREKWNQVCENWGFDIEYTPVTGRRSLTLTEYVRKQEAERHEKMKQLEDIGAYVDTELRVFEKRKKRIEDMLKERENKIAEQEVKLSERESKCIMKEYDLIKREAEFEDAAKQINEMQKAEIERLERSPDERPVTSFEQWVVNKNIRLNDKPLFQFYQEDIRNQRIIKEQEVQRQYKSKYDGAAARVLQKAEEMQQGQQDYNNYYNY